MNSNVTKRTPIGTISQGRIEQQKADHLAEVAGIQAPKWHRNPISDIGHHASCAWKCACCAGAMRELHRRILPSTHAPPYGLSPVNAQPHRQDEKGIFCGAQTIAQDRARPTNGSGAASRDLSFR